MKEAPKVSRYEASTRGPVTAAQNWSQLRVKVLNTRAESGISTIRLRYRRVYPSVRLKPGKTRLGLRRGERVKVIQRGQQERSATENDGRADRRGRRPLLQGRRHLTV